MKPEPLASVKSCQCSAKPFNQWFRRYAFSSVHPNATVAPRVRWMADARRHNVKSQALFGNGKRRGAVGATLFFAVRKQLLSSRSSAPTRRRFCLCAAHFFAIAQRICLNIPREGGHKIPRPSLWPPWSLQSSPPWGDERCALKKQWKPLLTWCAPRCSW